jgi:hypothetical protein
MPKRNKIKPSTVAVVSVGAASFRRNRPSVPETSVPVGDREAVEALASFFRPGRVHTIPLDEVSGCTGIVRSRLSEIRSGSRIPNQVEVEAIAGAFRVETTTVVEYVRVAVFGAIRRLEGR